MTAQATLTLDRPYYELVYKQWFLYRSRYRRWAIPISFVLTGIGLVTWFVQPLRLVAIYVILISLIDVVETTTHRSRWLKKAMRSERTTTARLQFTDSEIRINTENSNGAIRYEGFQSAISTHDGIFLVPHHGVSIFVPFATTEPQDVIENLVANILEAVSKL